jgi:hypothetical protein
LNVDEESKNVTVASNRDELRNAFEKLYLALMDDVETLEIQAQIIESKSEGIVEIQLLASPNEKVEKMIHLYNENISNLIEAVRYDVDDILLNLALFASMVRILNGQVKYESLGADGNLVSIILPKNQ